MNHSTETPTVPGYYAWASSKTDGWKLAKVYPSWDKQVLIVDSTRNQLYSSPVPIRAFVGNFKPGELRWRKLYTEEEVAVKVAEATQCGFEAGNLDERNTRERIKAVREWVGKRYDEHEQKEKP